MNGSFAAEISVSTRGDERNAPSSSFLYRTSLAPSKQVSRRMQRQMQSNYLFEVTLEITLQDLKGILVHVSLKVMYHVHLVISGRWVHRSSVII